ncbi:hypothetical protein CAEBREN_24346 [Caenorhabditis brenneri]|uniref:Uncharacterized protein n=1 Tax=Caenorhabditis brenneri TaxID=135651 RepID=G0NDE7_CAEBE|nr:hypothetical protein CAEBREN_24346 [Caenorhabditis brenneri]
MLTTLDLVVSQLIFPKYNFFLLVQRMRYSSTATPGAQPTIEGFVHNSGSSSLPIYISLYMHQEEGSEEATARPKLR